MKFNRIIMAVVGLLLSAALHAAPPIADFFDNAAFNGALLSPNGRYLAVLVGANDQHDGLAVIDLSDMRVHLAARLEDTDIGHVQWVNNERLLFTTVDKSVAVGSFDDYLPGLFAVDRDGKNYRQLAERRSAWLRNGSDDQNMLSWRTFMLGQTGTQDSDYVYVRSYEVVGNDNTPSWTLLRLNTRNGHAQPVDYPGIRIHQNWMLDQNGEPRITTTLDKDTSTINYLDPATRQWRALSTYNGYTGVGPFHPLTFGPDGALYVVASNQQGFNALFRYDLEHNKVAEQSLVNLDGFDFNGNLIISKQRLLGVRVHADAEGVSWFDPQMQALQQTINKLLPGAVNLVTPPTRPETPWMLVESYSDKQPRRYLVFNTETKRLTEVGRLAPKIKPTEMGPRDLYYFKARDGITIPVWVTLPPGGANKHLPAIVLVHGGPWIRGGTWDWDAEAEFLATRGYAVIEPEFRGSTGYGNALFEAGMKQWGLKMQDDVADATRWAIAQGYADSKRICIGGASYGGYATLMGLAKDPDLYKCGFEWVGVTDINLMYNPGWGYTSDASAALKRYGMPAMVGDPVKDAEQLKATSPLLLADRIRQPLLLAYGSADMRVPLSHGVKFRDAVQVNNHQVEWVVYDEEGHGWKLPKNRIDFWGRVERFLGKNIGKE